MDIDGKKVAETLRLALKAKIAEGKSKPSLAFILVGEDPASQTYVKMKTKAAFEVGIISLTYPLPNTVSETELVSLIHKLNADPSIDAILVQMPLPKQINEKTILLAISPEKDVDGFHPINVGKMTSGDPEAIIPCTPLGVLKLLEIYNVQTSGKRAVILGRSNIVGRPLANLLSQKRPTGDATVTLIHSHTQDIQGICKQADILIAAIGSPLFVKKEFIKEGAIVIDVGINRVNGKIVGDVDYTNVFPYCSLITPVPGGVGPMTIAMLLENTYKLHLRKRASKN